MTHSYDGNLAFLALDLELNQPSRRVIQVGVCIGTALQSEEEYLVKHWYLDPEEPIAPAITTLTGITDADIQSRALGHAAVAEELGQLVSTQACFVNPVVWGGGDRELLAAEFAARSVHFPYMGRRSIDVKTLHVFQQLAKGKSPAGGLRAAMSAYKMGFRGEPHRADDDAFNTLRLFFRMLERQRSINAMMQLATDCR